MAHGDLLREWVTCNSCGNQWVQGFYNDSPDPALPAGSVVLSSEQANLTVTALWHALHYLKFVEGLAEERPNYIASVEELKAWLIEQTKANAPSPSH